MTPPEASPIKLRFPPSPTGHWHLGGARSALFNWLLAKRLGGKFVLRSEDTDKARSDKKFELEIVETMKWLGLDWDEGIDWKIDQTGDWQPIDRGPDAPYRQSERTDIYKKYLNQLLAEGKAYYCYCSKDDLEAERQEMVASGLPPKYSGRCRHLSSSPAGKNPELIRFLTPEKEVAFEDLVRGRVSFDASLFGDMVIAKDIESPLYNFAVVVDDYLMGITHVIRGEEHLANTPKQILLLEALGLTIPKFGHLPLILAADRSKLSKRYAETSMLQYREDGYLPEALINFLVLLGWHPTGNQEIFSINELIAQFDISRVQKAGAIFNPEKLDWLNGLYIRQMEIAELSKKVKPFLTREIDDKLCLKILAAVRDRMTTLKDFPQLSEFFFNLPDYAANALVWKKSDLKSTMEALVALRERISSLDKNCFDESEIFKAEIDPVLITRDKGGVLWPLRVALSGLLASPDPYTIASILGKDEVLHRLNLAIEKVGSISNE